jgi:hypothetical protein
MKMFEEKWTAWLDGQLSGRELVEFEASLPDLAAAEAEKREVQKLGAFLKEQLSARVLTNEEFFSHQLSERIARETKAPRNSGSTWWTIPRLVWSGATALALFLVCALFVMREQSTGEQSEYLTQILNARVDPAVNPGTSITMFETKQDKVTVLWTEGLQSLPADYAAK